MYVAIEHGIIMQFKNKSAHGRQSSGSSDLITNIQGYRTPTQITLYSTSFHCMGLCETTQELWVSNGGQIDIINCKDFKVNKANRINLKILLTMCQLGRDYIVENIVCGETQVFCVLNNSSVILEFDAIRHTCTSKYNLEKGNCIMYNTHVVEKLQLQSYEHDAYKGALDDDESDRDRNNSVSSLTSSTEEELTSPCSPDGPSFSPIDIERSRNYWARVQSPDFVPLVPPRSPAGLRRPPPPVPVDNPITLGPPRPPKPVLGPRPSSDGDSSMPPVPERPSRFTIMTDGTLPPERPPRGSTIPTAAGNTNDRVFRTLPILYNRQDYSYSITCTSLVVVGNSLWVGRSCGDICVVNISEHKTDNSINPDYGKVIADMYDVHNKYRGTRTPVRVQLVPLGKYVMAAYTLSDERGSEVEVVAWDKLTVKDIEQVEGYWQGVSKLEKQTVQNQAQAHDTVSTASLQSIGEF